MQNLTGQTLDRYHILEQIGEGGMAVVYKAYDTRLETEVAVKFLRKDEFTPASLDKVLNRFEREAKALARLTHPNLVKVTDYGDHEGVPYLVMPYLPGGTLKQLMGKPMQFEEAAKILIPVANALGYAHQQGILHRDIKPSNILITENGEPMLSDFGIAKMLEENSAMTMTGTNVGIGTPEYMAPEQGLGKKVDGRADIYSLGVVLYELVTGQKPYTADTPMAVIFKHMTDPLPRPTEVRPGLSKGTEKVLLKALAKDPANRYQSMAELVAAMGKISEQAEGWRSRETLPTKPAILAQPEATIDEIQPVTAKITDRLLPGVKQTPWQRQDAGGMKTKPGWKFRWWQFALGGVVLVLLIACLLISPIIYQWVIAMKGVSIADNNESTRIELPGAMITDTPEPTSSTPLPPTIPTPTMTRTNPPPTTPSTPARTKSIEPTSTFLPPTYTPATSLGISSTQISPKDRMVMMYVPAGDFIMGSNDGDNDEQPAHIVFLDSYWIDRTEVTNDMFSTFVNDVKYQTQAEKEGESWVSWEIVEGANWQHPQGPSSNLNGLNGHPVVHVSWNDAQAYCAWAGRELPTEAQWEKAARGGDERTYPWGEERPAGNLVNFADKNTNFDWSDRTIDDGYRYTAPVGNFPDGASPYGALDLSGNVWEWVADFYGETYFERSPSNNPTGPDSGKYRVLRGGSWNYSSNNIRSTFRDWVDPSEAYSNNGFRCALRAIRSP